MCGDDLAAKWIHDIPSNDAVRRHFEFEEDIKCRGDWDNQIAFILDVDSKEEYHRNVDDEHLSIPSTASSIDANSINTGMWLHSPIKNKSDGLEP